MIDVVDSGTEELYFRVAEAQAADISRAVEAARAAFDQGPWPRMTHAERAGYLRAIAASLKERADDLGQIWPRESGGLHVLAPYFAADAVGTFESSPRRRSSARCYPWCRHKTSRTQSSGQ